MQNWKLMKMLYLCERVVAVVNARGCAVQMVCSARVRLLSTLFEGLGAENISAAQPAVAAATRIGPAA